MDLLWSNGILVNLATPNASPPPWLATDFPETLGVDRQGVRFGVGSRGHFCVIEVDIEGELAKLDDGWRPLRPTLVTEAGTTFLLNP
ncbi:beta-galactosidase [Nonomuraea sp. NPDC049695]|uniref:beta-galactosidase n=1 Tax=Nonomuraea sp. NPDC049695 TaxID=3154734 RepID=UPI00341286CF